MLIDWSDRRQAAPPAANAQTVVGHLLEWLQGTELTPASLFDRRSLITRVVRGLAVVMEMHAADPNGMCARCSVAGGLTPWPCAEWVEVAIAVHGHGRLEAGP